MPPETRIGLSFSLGSHGQRFLLAVGFSLPTAHDHRGQRGDCGYHDQDIKGNALGWDSFSFVPDFLAPNFKVCPSVLIAPDLERRVDKPRKLKYTKPTNWCRDVR